MCTTCGCGNSDETQKGSKTIEVGVSLLAANEAKAGHVRKHLGHHGTLAINLMSAPGSGKTALIERTLELSQDRLKIGVLAGDLETERDAERVRAKGALARAITTGQACHLDAFMVEQALQGFDHEALDLLFIENVGNLVCPSLYDVGAHLNVVLLSTTEGEDKPLKYPLVFRAAELVVLSKTDLLPYLDFDVQKAKAWIEEINPKALTLEFSAKTLEGSKNWMGFLFERLEALRKDTNPAGHSAFV